jgi:hypothetical protein
VASAYKFAPIFLIRMAGPPFEIIERLVTPKTSAAARDVLVRQEASAKAIAELRNFLRLHRLELPRDVFQAWRKAARTGVIPPGDEPQAPVFAAFRMASTQLAAAVAALEAHLPNELEASRVALFEAAQTALPRYLVFLDSALRIRLEEQSRPGPLPPRNKKARAHERHLALYIQRICAKNDSLSEFGPEGWGTLTRERGAEPLRLKPLPGIAARETFLERWTAHGLAAALNADAEIRLELAPRLNPVGRLEKEFFVRLDSNEMIPISTTEHLLLSRCDGIAPAYALEVDPAVLASLAQRGILNWQVEVPALDAHAFDVLVSDVRGWREGPARAKWLKILEPIAELPGRFADAAENSVRAQIMDDARRRLEDLGSARTSTNRVLYSAINPIGEECFRDCGFILHEQIIDEVAVDAAPWMDLWRDSYAFIASRVAVGLRGLFEKEASPTSAVPLPTFLRHCESLKMSLTGPGLVAFAHLAFQEVKAAFREQFQDRADAPEWELSADDCHFVRRNFQYEKFDEYTYPSLDLQLSSKSIEAIGRGEYQWVIAEMHPPAALLQHGFYWSCPDKPELSRALERAASGRPTFHFGNFAADFTSPTTVHLADSMPGLSTFVASQRGNPDWRVVSPADAEVYLDQETGDVCLRLANSKEYLGSFTRNWLIPLGFHPFQFGRPGHLPRLCCGRVVVQRRTWTISGEEIPRGDYTGISLALVLAVEQLRAKRDLPRHIFIRPTEQGLRRTGAEGRDKDTKPVFIDLESYLFVEIFYRWLTKAGELEVTEMLPSPDQLFWREADGRRTFELRTVIVPA